MQRPPSSSSSATKPPPPPSSGSRMVFVSNLPPQCDVQAVQDFLASLASVATNKPVRKCTLSVKDGQRYGFATFTSFADAEAVLARFESATGGTPPKFLNEHAIRVEKLEPKPAARAARTSLPPPPAPTGQEAKGKPQPQQQQRASPKPQQQETSFSVFIGRIPLAVTEQALAAVLPEGAPSFRAQVAPAKTNSPSPSSSASSSSASTASTSPPAASSSSSADNMWFAFLDWPTLDQARQCISVLRQSALFKQHSLRVELGHHAELDASGGREALAVFRRSVCLPGLPVGTTQDDVLTVCGVFGSVKRVTLRSPGSHREQDSAAAVLVVPDNLWRVQIEYETGESAKATLDQLQRSGFHDVVLRDRTFVLLDNLPSQPSLPDVLDMFSAAGSVKSANIVELTSSAVVEFADESVAKQVIAGKAPVLLRACSIAPQVANFDTTSIVLPRGGGNASSPAARARRIAKQERRAAATGKPAAA